MQDDVTFVKDGEESVEVTKERFSLDMRVRRYCFVWTFHYDETDFFVPRKVDPCFWIKEHFVKDALDKKYGRRYLKHINNDVSFKRKILKKWLPYREEHWYLEGMVYLLG